MEYGHFSLNILPAPCGRYDSVRNGSKSMMSGIVYVRINNQSWGTYYHQSERKSESRTIWIFEYLELVDIRGWKLYFFMVYWTNSNSMNGYNMTITLTKPYTINCTNPQWSLYTKSIIVWIISSVPTHLTAQSLWLLVNDSDSWSIEIARYYQVKRVSLMPILFIWKFPSKTNSRSQNSHQFERLSIKVSQKMFR